VPEGDVMRSVISDKARILKALPLALDNACYLQVELYSDRLDELKALFSRLGYRFLRTIDIDH
jgi:hypothetical protein